MFQDYVCMIISEYPNSPLEIRVRPISNTFDPTKNILQVCIKVDFIQML